MNKLLIIADDFTGALDTGVQLAEYGAATRVVTGPEGAFSETEGVQVLVIDTETRHMTARDAFETARRVTAEAVKAGFGYIYKKTDSALRGNVGADLAGVLAGSGAEYMAFLPAFPKMDRTTRGGVQYIGGVAVADSVFGRDPFEPVRVSSVAGIIAQQSDLPVILHGTDALQAPDRPGIHVYDAATAQDLRAAAAALKQAGAHRVLAGCAGMAAMLPELMDLGGEIRYLPVLRGRLLTVCGSVNPITRAQMDEAARAGALRLTLTPEQKLSEDWIGSPEGRAAVAGWLARIEKAHNAIVECGANDEATAAKVAELGLDLDQTRRRIASTMGQVLRQLLEAGLHRDLLVTGGDTLLAFMRLSGQTALAPLGEVQPGVVLSRMRFGGRDFNLLSKSGGFGTQTLLTDLAAPTI